MQLQEGFIPFADSKGAILLPLALTTAISVCGRCVYFVNDIVQMRYRRCGLISCAYILFTLFLAQTLTGSTKEERGIEALSRVPLHGFINDIAIGPKARFCVAAVGQEPRLGRWDRVSKAKNRFGIIQLRCDESESDEDDSSQDEGSSGGEKEHSDESD